MSTPLPCSAPAPPRTAYTPAEVAELLNCSVRHVQRLTRDNVIPGALRLGRLIRYSRGAVDYWLACGRLSLADSTAEQRKSDAV
jgi:excisionase family DNA binding protein